MEGRLLDGIAKRDDDATISVVDGQIYVETTEDLSDLEPWDVRVAKSRCCTSSAWTTLLNPNLLHDEAVAVPPSVHTLVVRHVFLTNLLFVGVAIVIGLAVSYWINKWSVLLALLIVSGTLFVALYLFLVVRRKLVPYGWCEAAFMTMAICAGFMVGSTAGLAGNVAPFEWCATLWAQTMMVLMYAQWSPRNMSDWVVLGSLMTAATMCVWALGIVAAFESHDWVSSGVVLLLSVCALFYQLAWIRKSDDGAPYSVSWRDLTVATMEFYGMVLVIVV